MGEITEPQVDAYPLGARVGTTYKAIETQLETGDCLVFCADGIMAALKEMSVTNDLRPSGRGRRLNALVTSVCLAGMSFKFGTSQASPD